MNETNEDYFICSALELMFVFFLSIWYLEVVAVLLMVVAVVL